MRYGILATVCWVVGFILSLIRQWLVVNIERLADNKVEQSFFQFVNNDIGGMAKMMIEPIFTKFDSPRLKELKTKVNILTYTFYVLIIAAILFYILNNQS